MNQVDLIAPYGGALVNLLVEGAERVELIRRAGELTSIQLSSRVLCDLELMATGAFSPLSRFMGRADYRRVLEEMRLADGTLFSIPVTLPVQDVSGIRSGQEIALRTATNNLMAWMQVEEIFERDVEMEARQICGPHFEEHPLFSEMQSWGRLCPERCAAGD